MQILQVRAVFREDLMLAGVAKKLRVRCVRDVVVRGEIISMPAWEPRVLLIVAGQMGLIYAGPGALYDIAARIFEEVPIVVLPPSTSHRTLTSS